MKEMIYTIGGKQYTESELLKFGKEHYPKFYWIYRGVGIGLMVIGVLSACIYLAIAYGIEKEFDDSFSYTFYAITAIFAAMAFFGAISFAVSFIKKPNEAYIKHAVDYYTRLNAKQIARTEKMQKVEERNSVKQLLEYKQLLDAGIITQEEFDKKKQELLK